MRLPCDYASGARCSEVVRLNSPLKSTNTFGAGQEAQGTVRLSGAATSDHLAANAAHD
jgi:hypothetical protein